MTLFHDDAIIGWDDGMSAAMKRGADVERAER